MSVLFEIDYKPFANRSAIEQKEITTLVTRHLLHGFEFPFLSYLQEMAMVHLVVMRVILSSAWTCCMLVMTIAVVFVGQKY